MTSISTLNNIEEKVIEAINTASLSFNELAQSLDVQESKEHLVKFQGLSDKFFTIVEKDIHKRLIDVIDSMTDVAVFDHSSYLKKTELEVSHNLTGIILSHLVDLENVFSDLDSINSNK
ncbi:putative mediator complex subunit 11 [Tieghemostelium lacteum]|uniref:Mediator of RNA polymerase II transcription subunit 11 n=1 Tax=Tieghemostelium lacteum TaxID=361077 RepID=A0A152A3Q8_TIELA|nr:putative mediator complex subunit 11 [Tieghemostelium lacteum]|eukprot:KYR00850.1 putative mediator complex subunit 11 [Tieghemostelium lacteum]